MAEFPVLPLFTDAYLGDTRHLSTIEHGAYLLLLITAWRTPQCRLPDDDKLLARYAGLTGAQWRRMRSTIEDFFHVDKGWWTQRRLTDEYKAVRQRRESQVANGRASALKRKGRHSTKRHDSENEASTPLNPSSSVKESNTKQSITEPREPEAEPDCSIGRLVNVDFLVDQACRLAGMVPNAQAQDQVRLWLNDGFDELLMLETIRSCMAGSTEPTSSLKRFDRAIRHAHAKLLSGLVPATNGNGGSKYVSGSGHVYRGDAAAVMREAEKRADWTTYYTAKADMEARA